MLNKLLLLAYSGESGYHKNYQRTVDYAKKLKAIYTGEAEGLLKQFELRESEIEFHNRKKLTSFITKAIAKKCTNPFNKALKNDEIKSVITPEDKAESILTKFDGGLTIDEFIRQKAVVLMGCDPNAWIVIDFQDYDYQQEKAKPYPLIYKSEDALDFEYDLGELVYLITKETHGFNLWMKDKGIKLIEIESDGIGQSVEYDPKVEKEYNPEVPIKIRNKYYLFEEFEHKVDKVPAFRVGYKLDIETDFSTYVSIIDDALPRIDKTIKSDSELDMAMAMHVFPQKVVRVKPCPGTSDYKCDNGYQFGVTTESGGRSTCKKCNGSGHVPLHTSTQDIIEVYQEADEDPIQLDNYIKYLDIDTNSVKFLTEYLKDLEDRCFTDVFTANQHSIKGVEKTATQSGIDYEAMHDVLYPFTQAVSMVREFLVDVVAQLKDERLEENRYSFPSDLNLQTFKELLEEYKKSDSAPEFVREDLIKKMSRKLNSQSPEDQLKFIRRLEHDPWAAKSESKKQSLISDGLCTDRDKVYYSYQNRVWKELEEENPNIYEVSYTMRQKLLDKKLDDWADKILTKTVPLQPLVEAV